MGRVGIEVERRELQRRKARRVDGGERDEDAEVDVGSQKDDRIRNEHVRGMFCGIRDEEYHGERAEVVRIYETCLEMCRYQ